MTSAGVVSFICVASAAYLFFAVREVVGKFDCEPCLSPANRSSDRLDVIPTNETSFFKGFKMIIVYKPFIILTVATVGSILATQV